MKSSLHLFHRDLRLDDNTALLAAQQQSDTVIPCFIFEPKQVEKNSYKSLAGIACMKESLHEVHTALQTYGSELFYFYGDTVTVLERIIQEQHVEAVFFNRDYTPFSRVRDEAIQALCKKLHIACFIFDDALLTTPEQVYTGAKKPYTIFTPFYTTAKKIPVATPKKNTGKHFFQGSIAFAQAEETVFQKVASELPKQSMHTGGRTAALAMLKRITTYKDYSDTRNLPALDATTHLSHHHKFGTVSIREVYTSITTKLPQAETLVRELYWRDFFSHIAYHFPHVFGASFHQEYDHIAWKNNTADFAAWCDGKTGFPIVDAGMRELNQTGFMHNRVRMITASFLIKDLHIDWRKGEQYFAQHLIDYDPAVNNGNWQWVAGTGCDAQPYFRIFNPWLQQKNYDPDAVYIKKWIPELEALSAKEIHALATQQHSVNGYPLPIIDHSVEAKKTKAYYEEARTKFLHTAQKKSR